MKRNHWIDDAISFLVFLFTKWLCFLFVFWFTFYFALFQTMRRYLLALSLILFEFGIECIDFDGKLCLFFSFFLIRTRWLSLFLFFLSRCSQSQTYQLIFILFWILIFTFFSFDSVSMLWWRYYSNWMALGNVNLINCHNLLHWLPSSFKFPLQCGWNWSHLVGSFFFSHRFFTNNSQHSLSIICDPLQSH